MDIKKTKVNKAQPIEVKKNYVEENLKKDSSTDALAKAIKTLMNKEKKN